MDHREIQQIIGLMQKNLECAICLDLMKNPVSTKCGHQFCGFCLREFLETKKSVPCPLCKKSITKRSLVDRPHLSEIVDNVRTLVNGFQMDTGQVFSPPRGPQMMNFQPSTPENLHTRSTRANKRKQKDVENLASSTTSNIRNSKRRKSDAPNSNQTAIDQDTEKMTRDLLDEIEKTDVVSAVNDESAGNKDDCVMVRDRKMITKENHKQDVSRVLESGSVNATVDIPAGKQSVGRTTRSRCKSNEQENVPKGKNLHRNNRVSTGKDDLLKYLANESCGAVETTGSNKSENNPMLCDGSRNNHETSEDHENDGFVELTYRNVEEEDEDHEDFDNTPVGKDLISLGKQAKLLKEGLKEPESEVITEVGKQLKDDAEKQPESSRDKSLHGLQQAAEVIEAEEKDCQFVMFSDIHTDTRVTRGKKKLEFQPKRKYAFREKTRTQVEAEEVTQLSGTSSNNNDAEHGVFSTPVLNVTRTYSKKQNPITEREQMVKQWLKTSENGENICEVDLIPESIDTSLDNALSKDGESGPFENLNANEKLLALESDADVAVQPVLHNRRKIFKTRPNNKQSNVSTTVKQLKGKFVVTRKVSPVREAEESTERTSNEINTDGQCTGSQGSDPYEFKTSQRTPRAEKGKKKISTKSVKKSVKVPISIVEPENAKKVVDLTIENPVSGSKDEEIQTQRSRIEENNLSLESGKQNSDCNSQIVNETGRKGRKGKQKKSPEIKPQESGDVEKIIEELSQAEEYDFITCTQEAQEQLTDDVIGKKVEQDTDNLETAQNGTCSSDSVSIIMGTENKADVGRFPTPKRFLRQRVSTSVECGKNMSSQKNKEYNSDAFTHSSPVKQQQNSVRKLDDKTEDSQCSLVPDSICVIEENVSESKNVNDSSDLLLSKAKGSMNSKEGKKRELERAQSDFGNCTEQESECASSTGTCVQSTDDSVTSFRTRKVKKRLRNKKSVSFMDKVESIDEHYREASDNTSVGQVNNPRLTRSSDRKDSTQGDTKPGKTPDHENEVTPNVCHKEDVDRPSATDSMCSPSQDGVGIDPNAADIIADTRELKKYGSQDNDKTYHGINTDGQSQTFDPEQEIQSETVCEFVPDTEDVECGNAGGHGTEESSSTQPPSDFDIISNESCSRVSPDLLDKGSKITKEDERHRDPKENDDYRLTNVSMEGGDNLPLRTEQSQSLSVVMETQMSKSEPCQNEFSLETQESVSLLVHHEVDDTKDPQDVVMVDNDDQEKCLVQECCEDTGEDSAQLRTRRNKLKRRSPKMTSQSASTQSLSSASGSLRPSAKRPGLRSKLQAEDLLEVIPATANASNDSTPIIQVCKLLDLQQSKQQLGKSDHLTEEEKSLDKDSVIVLSGESVDDVQLQKKQSAKEQNCSQDESKCLSSQEPLMDNGQSVQHQNQGHRLKKLLRSQTSSQKTTSFDQRKADKQVKNFDDTEQVGKDDAVEKISQRHEKESNGYQSDRNNAVTDADLAEEEDEVIHDLTPTLQPVKKSPKQVVREKNSPEDIFMMDSETMDNKEDGTELDIVQNQEGAIDIDYQSLLSENSQVDEIMEKGVDSQLLQRNIDYCEDVNVDSRKRCTGDEKTDYLPDACDNEFLDKQDTGKLSVGMEQKSEANNMNIGKVGMKRNENDSDSDLSQTRKPKSGVRCVRGLASRKRQKQINDDIIISDMKHSSEDCHITTKEHAVGADDGNSVDMFTSLPNDKDDSDIEDSKKQPLLSNLHSNGRSQNQEVLNLKEKFRKTFKKRASPRSNGSKVSLNSGAMEKENSENKNEMKNLYVDDDVNDVMQHSKYNAHDDTEDKMTGCNDVIPDSFPFSGKANQENTSPVQRSKPQIKDNCLDISERSQSRISKNIKEKYNSQSIKDSPKNKSTSKSDNLPKTKVSRTNKSTPDKGKFIADTSPESIDRKKRIVVSQRRRAVIVESEDEDTEEEESLTSSPLPDVSINKMDTTETRQQTKDHSDNNRTTRQITVVRNSDEDCDVEEQTRHTQNDDEQINHEREKNVAVIKDSDDEYEEEIKQVIGEKEKENIDELEEYSSSDESDTSRHLNGTSSSAFSSQSEAMTTQNRKALEKDLERMKREIAELEKQLANNPPPTNQSENKKKVSKPPLADDSDSDLVLDKDDVTDNEGDKEMVDIAVVSPSTGTATQRSHSSGRMTKIRDSEDSDELFLSPLPPSPPPTPSQSCKKGQLHLPRDVLETTNFLNQFCQKDITKDTSCSNRKVSPACQKEKSSLLHQANVSPAVSKSLLSTLCSSDNSDTVVKKDLISPMFETKSLQRSDRRPALSTLTDDSNQCDTQRHQHRGFLTTGLAYFQMREIQKLAQKNDSKFYVKFNSSVTHVIVKTEPVGSRVCDRTLKFFQGVAHRCWVLDYQWVIDSKAAGHLLPEEKYEIVGDMVTGDSHYGPKRSRLSNARLLTGYQFYCMGTSDSLTNEDLQDLIGGCGGTIITDPSEFSEESKHHLAVTCADLEDEDDVPTQEDIRLFNKLYKKYGVLTVSREWLLDTLTVYTVQPLEDYVLTTVKDRHVPDVH